MSAKQPNLRLGLPLICFLAGCATAVVTLIAVFHHPNPFPSNHVAQASKAGSRANAAATCIGSTHGDAQSHSRVVAHFGRARLGFEVNQGQTNNRVKYVARGNGYTLFLTSNEAVISMLNHPSSKSSGKGSSESASAVQNVVRMRMIGANSRPEISAAEVLPGRSNYFIGNDARHWRENVAQYGRVNYRYVYPGVDLAFHGEQRQVEFDFIVAPGADASAIELQLTGADEIATNRDGDLLLSSQAGDLSFHRPVAYQEQNGNRIPVEASFVLGENNQVSFKLGKYDRSRELVIDPTLGYSTYLGGSLQDNGLAIAADSAGNAYVTGQTLSTDFPPNPGTTRIGTAGNFDVFVTKLNSSGAIVFSDYIGGSQADSGNAIAVDGSGNIYVAGGTQSSGASGFPTTTNAFQTSFGGGTVDAFVVKLSSAGALSYGTFLGGSGDDIAEGLAVSGGNVFVTGETTSASDFPKKNAFQSANAGARDVFITELAPQGTGVNDLLYSTYLGGSNQDTPAGIAVDGSGNVYVAGITSSSDFPTTSNAYQKQCGTDGTCNGGLDDGFLVKLKTDGSQPLYSTFFGGRNQDDINGVAIDSTGAVYLTGFTKSTDFPTKNAFQAALVTGSTENAFVTKLNPAGGGTSDLTFSTFFGGNISDRGLGIAVDASKNVYLTGETSSSANFPLLGALSGGSALQGSSDAFVSELKPDGSALVFSTYFGGNAAEDALAGGIAVDASSNIYVTGDTASPANFPLQGAAQGTYGGSVDAFVAKIAPATFSLSVTLAGNGGGIVTSVPAGITCGSTCSASFANATVVTLTAAANSGSTFAGWSGGGCSGTSTCIVTITAAQTVTATFNSSSAPDFSIAAGAASPASVKAGGSATSTVTVSPLNGFTSDVAVTCSVSPVKSLGPTCGLNPATVTGGNGTSTLTISTTAATSSLRAPGNQHAVTFYAMWLPVGGIVLFGAGIGARKKMLLGLVLMALTIGGLVFLVGCGGSGKSGGSSGTPSGSYTITVTGTAGSTTHTATTTLTVQ